MLCMVHMPHTQHGLWVDARTPTAHGMYGTHATHTARAVGRCIKSTAHGMYGTHATHTAWAVGQ